MTTAIVAIVSALAALILALTVLFGVVVLGIRREPTDAELRRMAPSLTSQAVRRLLGVYARRPEPSSEGR
jgi:hypothetical protein